MSKTDILNRIVERKLEEIRADLKSVSLTTIRANAEHCPQCRGFLDAIRARTGHGKNAVIAEAKKASPSKGIIREKFNITQIAESYQDGGATCLSVLTDRHFFQGNLSYLGDAKVACGLPVIRKDFIIDEYQVYQSKVAAADCILLIVSALDPARLLELTLCAQQIGLDVLVEVHDQAELEVALQLEGVLLGINNRNLRTFDTRLETTIELMPHVPDHITVVTESGILTKADIQRMNDYGVHAFLIGEAFMRAESPGKKLKELFS